MTAWLTLSFVKLCLCLPSIKRNYAGGRMQWEKSSLISDRKSESDNIWLLGATSQHPAAPQVSQPFLRHPLLQVTLLLLFCFDLIWFVVDDVVGFFPYYIPSWIFAICIQRLTNRQTFLDFLSLPGSTVVCGIWSAGHHWWEDWELHLSVCLSGPAGNHLHPEGQNSCWLNLLLCRDKEIKRENQDEEEKGMALVWTQGRISSWRKIFFRVCWAHHHTLSSAHSLSSLQHSWGSTASFSSGITLKETKLCKAAVFVAK